MQAYTPAPGSPIGSTPGGHIVVVDDEPMVRKTLRWQLSRFEPPYTIVCVSDGFQAARLLDRLKRDSSDVALIIADQALPERSGVEVLQDAHRRYPQAGKVLITGHRNFDIVTQAVNLAGLDRFIAKPWTERELCATVGNLLVKHGLWRENEHLIVKLKRDNARLAAQVHDLQARLRNAGLSTDVRPLTSPTKPTSQIRG